MDRTWQCIGRYQHARCPSFRRLIYSCVCFLLLFFSVEGCQIGAIQAEKALLFILNECLGFTYEEKNLFVGLDIFKPVLHYPIATLLSCRGDIRSNFSLLLWLI